MPSPGYNPKSENKELRIMLTEHSNTKNTVPLNLGERKSRPETPVSHAVTIMLYHPWKSLNSASHPSYNA